MSEYSATSAADHHECKTLLDACTPLVYVQSAFRISGLAVDASPRDIKRRIDDLRHAEELGDAETEHTHAFALDPLPTIEHIREAAKRLQDPERRIVEEFFWFWPAQWGSGRSDPSLSALMNGDKDTAFRIWSSSLANSNGAAAIVAKHNLAVMYHLVALDSEHYAMESDLEQAQLDTIGKYWRTAFKWWEDLTTDETFWSLVADRIRMLDDPRLTTGFARRMRTALPEALDKINAMLAIAFFERGKHELGKNHVTYMRETHQGQDDVAKTLAAVTQPLKTRVANAVERTRTAAERDPKNAAQTALDLQKAVADPLKIIRMILPSSNHERIDLCDSVAEACLTCHMACARETKDWSQCTSILDEAASFAESQDTRLRIEEERKDVIAHVHLARINDECESIRSKTSNNPASGVTNARALHSTAPRWLEALIAKGVSGDVMATARNMIAATLYGCAISYGNKTNDWPPCVEILRAANQYASNAELRQQIKDNLRVASGNLERQALRERCWFCKKDKGTPSGVLKVPMHGEVDYGLGDGTIRWKHLTVDVPRCDSCRRAHRTLIGSIAGGVVGGVLGSVFGLLGQSAKILTDCTSGGARVGNKIQGALCPLPTGVAPEATKDAFPDIQDLLARGWRFGARP